MDRAWEARTFWVLLFEHGIALGGLCAGNVLVRTALEDENHLEALNSSLNGSKSRWCC